VERLILDTSVLVSFERDPDAQTNAQVEDADLAIAAITASELLVGVDAADPRRAGRRRAIVDSVLTTFTVVPFDLATARHHAVLLAHARESGRPRGVHDLLIAATARATNRTVVTRDTRGFSDLPGVSVRVLA
jgi:tRNA(fMet)-specific endonuclease VapC